MTSAALIDSHCHLTSAEFTGREEEVIARAMAAGVGEFITIATDIADAAKALALAERHPAVHVAAGIHPHQAGKVEPGWDTKLREIASRDDIVAVGEMGLDYHYDFSDRDAQFAVFQRQLEIASEAGKPVVIHCREAHADLAGVLREFPSLAGVVFHCFTGTRAEADDILDSGWWLSLTGVVTFKKSAELREIAKMLPADQIMVETDSPYLSPEPVRNMRPNEPANVVHTAACIARERGLTSDEFAALSAANTRRFFKLPVRPDGGPG